LGYGYNKLSWLYVGVYNLSMGEIESMNTVRHAMPHYMRRIEGLESTKAPPTFLELVEGLPVVELVLPDDVL
jgi:hypothetical protein